jgi:hypothetical protein
MDGAPERFWPGENGQRQERGVGWKTVVVESGCLRCSAHKTRSSASIDNDAFVLIGKGTDNGKSGVVASVEMTILSFR